MSTGNRVAVIALVLLAVGTAAGLVLFASAACPTEIPGQACPEAGRNRLVLVLLAATAAGLLVTPFAFTAEFAARARIVYRGSWARATRRGVLVAALVATLAGLRLAGALTPAGGLFVLAMAAAIEWFAVRRVDLP